jgi:hypothetical protein
MAAQKGFEYEKNAWKFLKEYGVTGSTEPAGASHDKPDLEIKLATKADTPANLKGCELKLSPTAAGSLVLKYTNGKWGFTALERDADPEKVLLVDLAKQKNVLREMNTSGSYGARWRGTKSNPKVPFLQNDEQGKKIYIIPGDYKKNYKKDIEQFGGEDEVKIPIDGKVISDYYISKKCYYINVGTHGFYLLGSSDPLGLNKKLAALGGDPIPLFDNEAKARIRVRCQDKSGSYQFTMNLDFTSVSKSAYNIAPINSASDVNISTTKFNTEKNNLLMAAFRK